MDSPTQNQLGHIVKRLRGRLRLSQPEVARRGGLSLQAVWSIENGQVVKPQESTLAGLAEALETTVEFLLGEEPAAPAAGNGSVGTPEIHGAPTDHPATGPVSDSPDQASSSLPKPSTGPAAPAGESRREAIAPADSGSPPVA